MKARYSKSNFQTPQRLVKKKLMRTDSLSLDKDKLKLLKARKLLKTKNLTINKRNPDFDIGLTNTKSSPEHNFYHFGN